MNNVKRIRELEERIGRGAVITRRNPQGLPRGEQPNFPLVIPPANRRISGRGGRGVRQTRRTRQTRRGSGIAGTMRSRRWRRGRRQRRALKVARR